MERIRMAELTGNLLVAQAGATSAVANSILAGVIQQAGKHECLEEIYGGLHGIRGVLREDLVDLNEELARVIEGLKYTPATALGACGSQFDSNQASEKSARDLDRLFEVFQAHNIRYFVYIGSGPSLADARRIDVCARDKGYELRVVGVPACISNDLPHTDHCPGYGSAIKFGATTAWEIAAGLSGMDADQATCAILEVAGRDAGWLAAGSALARRSDSNGPHIVLLPEVPLAEAAFLARVQELIASKSSCLIVASEGLKEASGKSIVAPSSHADAFGALSVPGVAEYLSGLIKKRLGIDSRCLKLSSAQLSAAYWASATDVAEAVACGEGAVRAAVHGQSGIMVKLVRLADAPYKCTTDVQPLADVASGPKLIPREWISENGLMPNEAFLAYARPLIAGEFKAPMEGGLPKFAALSKAPVEKKLSAFA